MDTPAAKKNLARAGPLRDLGGGPQKWDLRQGGVGEERTRDSRDGRETRR